MDNINKTPVFFHIPKNSGTYFLNRSFAFASIINDDSQADKTNVRLEILSDGDIKYRLICFDNERVMKLLKYFTHVLNDRVYQIDIKDCSKDLFQFFDIFAVVICDRGFGSYKEELYPLLPYSFSPFYIISLRDAFSRSLSMYSYVQSDKSSHEEYHDAFKDISFDEYLNSDLIEESWLISQILFNGDKSIKIKQKDLDEVVSLLDTFDKVIDYKDIWECLCETYMECYGINAEENKEKLDSWLEVKNETPEKLKIKFSDLKKSTRDVFIKNSKWEKILFDRYITDNKQKGRNNADISQK